MHRSEIPQFVHAVNVPSAQELRTKLKQREEVILADLDENEILVMEYHSPADAVIRIRDIGYYQDVDNAIRTGAPESASGGESRERPFTEEEKPDTERRGWWRRFFGFE